MSPKPNPTAEAERGDDREERLAALLESARAGRRGSLGEIVAELTPLLWHVVRAQGLDRELAEDVVQTTWLRLLDHLHSIQTPRALTGWLVTGSGGMLETGILVLLATPTGLFGRR